MSSFGQDFWQGFTATNSLRDYTHASRTFRTNAYELKPRFKFLFHVVFNINVDQIPGLANAKIFQPTQRSALSLSVKTIDLPKYSITNETLNQYNRKRVVQTKINYDPVSVTFHDDGGDNVREMWYQYYSYYYKDPAQKYVPNIDNTNGSIGANANRQTGMNYNARDIYAQERTGNVNDWGYIGENYMDGTTNASGKPPFFKDIEIFGFDQHKYARYILINPVITSWAHDQYDYSQGAGIMQNSMTIAYETVKYYSGALGKAGVDPNVTWPDQAHYDNVRSAISRPGSTASIFGQGGILSTGQGILADLQRGSVEGLIGAAQKAGTAYNTWKGKDIRSVVKAEATSLGKEIIQAGVNPNNVRSVAGRADGWVFPTGANAQAAQAQRNINAGAAGL